MSDAILFDRDKVQRLHDIGDRPRRLSGSKLLWVDVDRDSEESTDRVAEAFGLDRDTRTAWRARTVVRLPRPRPLRPRHHLRARRGRRRRADA